MFREFIEFVVYSGLIIIISKYILVNILRKFAENLELKPKTIGHITGYATSIPELLTITIASINGLYNTSIFNILSSNIINLVQYIISVISNKNKKAFTNKAIKIDIVLILFTIIIPMFIICKNIKMDIKIIPIFIILYLLFQYLNNNTHKLYLEKEQKEIEERIEEEVQFEKGKTRKTVFYIISLISVGILLYIIGERLGENLESLCIKFKIPEFIIGILLGFITSIPELITFFESQRYYKLNNDNELLGVVEATNNLFISNILNIFVIQTIGILISTIFT